MIFINFLLISIIVLIFFQTFLIGTTMDSIKNIEKMIKEYINKKEVT